MAHPYSLRAFAHAVLSQEQRNSDEILSARLAQMYPIFEADTLLAELTGLLYRPKALNLDCSLHHLDPGVLKLSYCGSIDQ